jgi:ComF family protein
VVYKRLLHRQPWTLASCLCCNQPIRLNQDFCRHCRNSLPYIDDERLNDRKSRCCRCASTLPDTLSPNDLVCGQCQSQVPGYACVRALFSYRFPVDRLIQNIKYQHQLYLIRIMARLWSEKLHALNQQADIDLILPVPLHKSRLRERGFNQSLELARPIGRKLQIPVDAHSLHRKRRTSPQTKLLLKDRMKNVRGAFEADREKLAGKRVVLLDDVMTTGSTVNAITDCLKRAGTKYIEVWVLARA